MANEYYAKLDQNIVYSSMWEEDGDTVKVWITMLALKNYRTGIVDKNVTGIARLCNLPIEKVEAAILKFEAPDPKSTTKDHDGRRLRRVEGGWLVLNHGKYIKFGWSDEKREYERIRKAQYREAKKETTEDTKEPETQKKVVDPIVLQILEAYPRKVAKQKTITAIENAIRTGIAADELLKRTSAYAKTRIGEDEKFTPYPATWFNQGRYNDLMIGTSNGISSNQSTCAWRSKDGRTVEELTDAELWKLPSHVKHPRNPNYVGNT